MLNTILYSTVQCHIPSHRHGAGSYLPFPSISQIGKLPIFGKNWSQSSPVLWVLPPLWQYSYHSPAVTGALFSRHYQFLQLLNSTELVGKTCSADINFPGWAAWEGMIKVRGQTCSTARVGQAWGQVKIKDYTVPGFGKSIHSFHPFCLQTCTDLWGVGCCQNRNIYILLIFHIHILIHIYVPVSTLSPPDQTSLFLPGENVLLLSTGSRDTSMTSCRAGEAGTTEWNSLQGLRAGRGYLKETAQQSSGTERLRRIHSNFRLSWQQLL